MHELVALDRLGEQFDLELRGGDDRALWEDLAARAAADVAALDDGLESPPRHVLFQLARVPRHHAGVHPDEHATLRLAWERDRGAHAWTFAGRNPRIRSRHGSYSATVCVPAGTVGLAWVDVVVLWRPRLPFTTNPRDLRATRRRSGERSAYERRAAPFGCGLRPRRAPPEDHETGRQTYRYRRDAAGAWRFAGATDA